MTPSFEGCWATAVAQHHDRPFLVFSARDGRVDVWTYGAFDDAVARAAGALREAGVGPGTAVQLVLRNCPGFIAIWLAASRLGAWMLPVDPASTRRDLAQQIARIHPSAVVVGADQVIAFREAVPDFSGTVLVLAEDSTDLAPGAPLHSEDAVHAVLAADPDQRLAVMFTSGTTSQPKAVELTQGCYANVARAMSEAVGLQARHRFLVTLPLFHANAQYYCFAPAIAAGASVALTATFSASRWVQLARSLKATHASLFAAPIRMILARTSSSEAPLGLEHVWFAQSLGASHHAQFAALAGVAPRQLYGMTETVAPVCVDTSQPAAHDVIGRPMPGRQVRVVDPDTGDDAATGLPGELLVRGERGRDLFAGYLDDETVNARVFSGDGDLVWFSTGDLVSRDSDGQLRFVGRVDDVIKVSGENVSLTEVEAVAAQAPGVLEVAVIARADETRDQVPVAYIVPRDPSTPPSTTELETWAERNLAPAARPREWHVIDALPRTSVGKVRRFRIAHAVSQDI